MTDASVQLVARRLGRDDFDAVRARHALKGVSILLDGYGSIARPLAEALAQLGARRFVLNDPKRYGDGSIHSQCEPHEVGLPKVEVGARRLRALGAEAASYARDLFAVPDGAIQDPSSIVVATLDNRRADIGSNRRAARMGARLVKANVEPAADVVALRAYDYRRGAPLCAECQFAEKHYETQRHPKSCDGPAEGRPTNSPRSLSRAAALMAAIAIVDLAADDAAASQWIGRERQYCHATGAVSSARLMPKPDCKWDHDRRWHQLRWLNGDARSISLADLFDRAELTADVRARIHFCQQVALAGRCRDCQRRVATVRWITDSNDALGDCPSCGGPTYAFGFWTFAETSVEPLVGVLGIPLADWGVENGAVIELARDDRRRAFVIGVPRGDTP